MMLLKIVSLQSIVTCLTGTVWNNAVLSVVHQLKCNIPFMMLKCNCSVHDAEMQPVWEGADLRHAHCMPVS